MEPTFVSGSLPPATHAGYLHALVYNKKHILSLFEEERPVLQILNLRFVEKHAVYLGDLSDGVYFVTARFDKSLNDTLSTFDAAPYVQATCVIKVVNTKIVAYVHRVKLIHQGNACPALETPLDVALVDPEENTEQRHREIVDRLAQKSQAAAREKRQAEQAEQLARRSVPGAAAPQDVFSASTRGTEDDGSAARHLDDAELNGIEFLPLTELRPNMNYFTIRVRVENMQAREWKSRNGSGGGGTLLNVTVSDSAGHKMRLVTFDAARFQDVFVQGETFVVTGGTLALGNQQYLADPRVTVELKMDKNTRVTQVKPGSANSIRMDLGTVATSHQINKELASDAVVTFLGYFVAGQNYNFIESKKTGKRFPKLEFIMVDVELNPVFVTVLGDMSDRLFPHDESLTDFHLNPNFGQAMILQNFKVDMFSGKPRLSGGFSGSVMFEDEVARSLPSNPELQPLLSRHGAIEERRKRIAELYEANSNRWNFGHIDDTTGSSIDKTSFSRHDANALPATVDELIQKAHDSMDEYKATNIEVSGSFPIYKLACQVIQQDYRPSEGSEAKWPWYYGCTRCQKKVTGDELSGFVCPGCSHTMNDEAPPLRLFCWTVSVVDSSAAEDSESSAIQVTLFDEPTSRLLYTRAQEIYDNVAGLSEQEQKDVIETGMNMILGRRIVLYLRPIRPSVLCARAAAAEDLNLVTKAYECVDACHDHDGAQADEAVADQ